MSLRIAIIGAGGLGGLFGARLVHGGADVTFLVRGDTFEALRSGGLTLTTPDESFTVPVAATDDPASVGHVDVVLHTTKATGFRDALSEALPVIGPETIVVTTQNGVEAPDIAAEYVAARRVLPGIARVFSEAVSPGVIEVSGGPGSLAFGTTDGSVNPHAQAFRMELEIAGVPVVVPADIRVELWEKAMYVVPHGALGALVDEPLGVLRGALRGTFAAAASEIAAVGRSRGIALEADAVERVLAFIDRLPTDSTASLHRDLVAGRPSELDAQVGAICRFGAEAGVGTPMLDLVLRALAVRVD